MKHQSNFKGSLSFRAACAIIIGLLATARGFAAETSHPGHVTNVTAPEWSEAFDSPPNVLGHDGESGAYIPRVFALASYVTTAIMKGRDSSFALSKFTHRMGEPFIFIIKSENPMKKSDLHYCFKIEISLMASPTDMSVDFIKYTELQPAPASAMVSNCKE